MTSTPNVLFLCVHNAGRSQMAAGWMRHLAGDSVGVYSAGSEPAETINAVAVEAMAEVGIDIVGNEPQRWTDEMLQEVDVVITMGCGDECPYVPGTRYEDWELTDPAGQGIATVRPIRDEIGQRVRGLLAELVPPAQQPVGSAEAGRSPMGFDLDVAKAFSLKVWQYKQGEVVSAMVHLGDRLGLYRSLYTQGPATSELLADATGLDERWLREWLLGQAAAGLVERSAEAVYSMTDEQAAVLVDEDSLLFATASFGGGFSREDYDRMTHSMETGIGFTYGEMGIEAARQLDRTNAPWLRGFLPTAVIPLLPGVVDKLKTGARVLDIGCGGGVALEGLITRYPNSRYVGMDPSGPAVEVARERFDGQANVEIHLAGGETLHDDEGFDLVMTLDCLHDMSRPDQTAQSIRGALKEDGTWLVKEIKCGPTYESNQRNPLQALMYGYSVSSCLASATVEEDGLGLGTLGMDPDTLAKIAEEAGFTSFEKLSTPDPVHFYYRIAV